MEIHKIRHAVAAIIYNCRLTSFSHFNGDLNKELETFFVIKKQISSGNKTLIVFLIAFAEPLRLILS